MSASGPALRRAVFLDRDGVLNEERGFVCCSADLRPLPGLATALRRLREAGWLRIVVSNQSALARGLVSWGELTRIHRLLRDACEDELDAILVCPHHPHEGLLAMTRRCSCRKPAPGLLRHAGHAFGLDPAQCWLIGDAVRDIAAAHAFGCPSIGIRGAKLPALEDWPEPTPPPRHVARDLPEAVDWLLAH